jgi:cystathionine gamma-synthase/methionine-gamma-lyase
VPLSHGSWADSLILRSAQDDQGEQEDQVSDGVPPGEPRWSFDTTAVHAGRDVGPVPDPSGRYPGGLGRPVAPAIQPSASYSFERLADLNRAFDDPAAGFVYARHGAPTAAALGRAVAALEGTDGAVAFASGMAAIHAALLAAGTRAGDTVVASRDLYGATQALLSDVLAGLGVRVHLVDATDAANVRDALEATRPRVVFVETMSNPLLRLVDLPAVAALARHAGARFIVDNTFASPYLCRPGEYGADLIVHSATKYLGGHGDLTAGVVAAAAEFLAPLQQTARLVGGTLGAFDAWLALRGIRTLALRLERQCANAQRVAAHLAAHPMVQRVHYPGLKSHPHHALAVRLYQGRGFGGVVSLEIRGASPHEVGRFMDALRLILPAPTLGDVYSLALYPAQSSHRGLTPEQRAHLGIGDDLVRLSLGIESAADLLADLDQALEAAGAAG